MLVRLRTRFKASDSIYSLSHSLSLSLSLSSRLLMNLSLKRCEYVGEWVGCQGVASPPSCRGGEERSKLQQLWFELCGGDGYLTRVAVLT